MLPDSLRKIFLAITLLNLDRKRSLGQTLFSVLSPEETQGNYDLRMVSSTRRNFRNQGGIRDPGSSAKKGTVKNGAKGMSDMAG